MVAILTFHWADDYGAMLQAYALKYCLEKFSKEQVEIIPYSPVRLEGRYWLFPITGREEEDEVRYFFMKSRFKKNISFFFKFLRRRKSMRSFRKQYLTWKPAVRKADMISLKKYSVIFVGSDQVWNPEITVGLDDAYTGNIKEKGDCKCVSYGASFGTDVLPERYHARFKGTVCKNFSAVSLREKKAVPFVKRFFSGYVTDVLDPTLLLERKEWEQIANLPKQHGYILFVYTEYNKQMVQYIKGLSAQLKKNIIQLSIPWTGQETDWVNLKLEGGPSEFIGFFQNAGYVVTNSFHGTAFSVLMEKNFLTFSHSNKNVRIENLLEKVGLKSRLIERGRVPSKNEILKKIDWICVRKLLEEEKWYSVQFIKKFLL